MKWLRCILADDGRDVEFTIDVIVDEDGRVQQGHSYFGSWRNGRGLYPVVLLPMESALDFGVSLGGPNARYATLPMYGRCIWKGARFEYKNAEETFDIEVLRTRDLVAELTPS